MAVVNEPIGAAAQDGLELLRGVAVIPTVELIKRGCVRRHDVTRGRRRRCLRGVSQSCFEIGAVSGQIPVFCRHRIELLLQAPRLVLETIHLVFKTCCGRNGLLTLELLRLFFRRTAADRNERQTQNGDGWERHEGGKAGIPWVVAHRNRSFHVVFTSA